MKKLKYFAKKTTKKTKKIIGNIREFRKFLKNLNKLRRNFLKFPYLLIFSNKLTKLLCIR